jgi:hypothetical protein
LLLGSAFDEEVKEVDLGTASVSNKSCRCRRSTIHLVARSEGSEDTEDEEDEEGGEGDVVAAVVVVHEEIIFVLAVVVGVDEEEGFCGGCWL